MFIQYKHKKTGALAYGVGYTKVKYFKRAKHSYSMVRSAENPECALVACGKLAKEYIETGKIFAIDPCARTPVIQELRASPYGGWVRDPAGETYPWKTREITA